MFALWVVWTLVKPWHKNDKVWGWLLLVQHCPASPLLSVQCSPCSPASVGFVSWLHRSCWVAENSLWPLELWEAWTKLIPRYSPSEKSYIQLFSEVLVFLIVLFAWPLYHCFLWDFELLLLNLIQKRSVDIKHWTWLVFVLQMCN